MRNAKIVIFLIAVTKSMWSFYPPILNAISIKITGKSSCVNARGIPTPAYQVLHLLPEVGYPLAGVPPWPGLMGGTQGGVPQQGYPPARSDGGLPLAGVCLARSDGERGYLGWGIPPGRGTPWPGLMGVPKVG